MGLHLWIRLVLVPQAFFFFLIVNKGNKLNMWHNIFRFFFFIFLLSPSLILAVMLTYFNFI